MEPLRLTTTFLDGREPLQRVCKQTCLLVQQHLTRNTRVQTQIMARQVHANKALIPVEAEEVCPRARFYAQDFRQVITATALAIAPVNRLGAAATLRKLQRVAIQHDKYLNAGLSGKGKETWMLLCFLRKLNLPSM